MRNYIFLIIAGLLLTQCQKDSDFNDLGGSSILSGVVVIVDTLNGPVTSRTAPNLMVYLRYNSQVSSYLVSNKADRAQLPKPKSPPIRVSATDAEPETALERVLCEALKSALGLDKVSIANTARMAAVIRDRCYLGRCIRACDSGQMGAIQLRAI